jgi:hypothetical protein
MAIFAPKTNLKDRIRLKKQAVLAFGAMALLWVNFGFPTTLAAWGGFDLPTRLLRAAPTLLSMVVLVIDALPGHHLKAVLVFWRLRHPLPGSRVFDAANLDSDTRIDKKRLRDKVGRAFPRAPAEQNKLWFELYRSVETDVRIEGLHAEYLMLRDLTWFSVVFALAALAGMVIGQCFSGGPLVFAAVCALFYLLLRRAASERGCRFANTVLALASTSKESKE